MVVRQARRGVKRVTPLAAAAGHASTDAYPERSQSWGDIATDRLPEAVTKPTKAADVWRPSLLQEL
jgi:hypothetical protein